MGTVKSREIPQERNPQGSDPSAPMAGSLGQGLGALFGRDAVDAVERQRIHRLPLTSIQPNPWQPRQEGLHDAALEELAQSIRTQGVLQPILVRPLPDIAPGGGGLYQLIAGERRWRAAKLAGLNRIPAIVRDMDDRESLEVAILENVQREDLNPVETARGYARLVQEFGYSHAQVAQRIGKSRMAVTNSLRLLHLPETILQQLADRQFSAGHARALLGVADNPQIVLEMANQVIADGLTVRATERLVQAYLLQSRKPDPRPPEEGEGEGEGEAAGSPEHKSALKSIRRRDSGILALEKRLALELQTQVTITHTQGRGRIVIEYDSLDSFARLIERLVQDEGGTL